MDTEVPFARVTTAAVRWNQAQSPNRGRRQYYVSIVPSIQSALKSMKIAFGILNLNVYRCFEEPVNSSGDHCLETKFLPPIR